MPSTRTCSESFQMRQQLSIGPNRVPITRDSTTLPSAWRLRPFSSDTNHLQLPENILEVVELGLPSDPFGGQHCSLGKSAARLDFVGEHDTIAGRDQLQRVNAGNVALALGSDLDALSRCLLQQPL